MLIGLQDRCKSDTPLNAHCLENKSGQNPEDHQPSVIYLKTTISRHKQTAEASCRAKLTPLFEPYPQAKHSRNFYMSIINQFSAAVNIFKKKYRNVGGLPCREIIRILAEGAAGIENG